MTDQARVPDELSETLRALRQAADMTLAAAAATTGIGLGSLSRYERGTFVPPPERVESLARLYKAPATVRRRLVALAKGRRQETKRVVLHRGAVRFQQRVRDLEAASSHVATFQPAVIPGILQTEGYMRALTGSAAPDVADGVIRYRLERQRLLGRLPHRFTQIITAGALLWCIGDRAVMVDQLVRLVEASRLVGVRVGVIPPMEPAGGVFAMHGFDIYDGNTVIVGTLTATAVLTDPSDVRAHVQLLAELERLAVFGDEARDLLARIAADYRR